MVVTAAVACNHFIYPHLQSIIGMDVTFKTCTGKSFTLELGFFDTVLEMKEKIHKYQGIPVSKQTLVFKGQAMADEHDTEFYEILQGSHLHLFLENESGKPIKTTQDSSSSSSSSSGKFQILVKVPTTSRKFSLEVSSSDTVGRVKERIHKMEGIPMNRTVLVASGGGGQEMEEHRSLGEYGICEYSEISVSVKPPQKLSLVIRTPSGENKMVEMNTTDKVDDVRKELQRLHQIPPENYFFIHKQNVMDDHRSLRWHDVHNGDTIFVFTGKISGGT